MFLGESVVKLVVENLIFDGFGAILSTSVTDTDTENLIVPLDRARRVVLGTTMEHLKHVVRRICAVITSSGAE